MSTVASQSTEHPPEQTSGHTTDARPAAGMGAILRENGVAFRVWAPHATAVSVIGDFNHWKPEANPMVAEENGHWFADVPNAKVGAEYRFLLKCGDTEISRLDPYAREVTSSIGNSIICDPAFDWTDEGFQRPGINELVIYELHIGTFHRSDPEKPGTFDDAIEGLAHLKKLGVNCIEVMPAAEFAGDLSWGYNPAHMFAVEQAYGGPEALKRFVDACHKRGIAVILDVVYNHFGPSDLDIWQFDGWSENDGGGIYFYNDWRKDTPWGATRPDYGRAEVRDFIKNNARMWLVDYHVDGLRFDMTLYIRTVDGGGDLADGWSLMREINAIIHDEFPGRYGIAEDLQDNDFLTKPANEGGGGFDSQWCALFVHTVREAVITPQDEDRPLDKVCDAIQQTFNGEPFQRVIYSESHDEVANGKARVTYEVSESDPQGYYAQKKSTLAAGLVFTTPGVPMLFQGQEFLMGGWFQDTVPLDWDLNEEYQGIVRLYRDLIRLRLDKLGTTKGLTGSGVKLYYCDNDRKLIAWQRWYDHGAGDDVVVVANFSHQTRTDVGIPFPSGGMWQVRLNTDWKGYSKDFANTQTLATEAIDEPLGDFGARARVTVGPYSLVIFSQD